MVKTFSCSGVVAFLALVAMVTAAPPPRARSSRSGHADLTTAISSAQPTHRIEKRQAALWSFTAELGQASITVTDSNSAFVAMALPTTIGTSIITLTLTDLDSNSAPETYTDSFALVVNSGAGSAPANTGTAEPLVSIEASIGQGSTVVTDTRGKPITLSIPTSVGTETVSLTITDGTHTDIYTDSFEIIVSSGTDTSLPIETIGATIGQGITVVTDTQDMPITLLIPTAVGTETVYITTTGTGTDTYTDSFEIDVSSSTPTSGGGASANTLLPIEIIGATIGQNSTVVTDTQSIPITLSIPTSVGTETVYVTTAGTGTDTYTDSFEIDVSSGTPTSGGHAGSVETATYTFTWVSAVASLGQQFLETVELTSMLTA